MSGDRSVVDQALDLLVYAPLGLALEAKDLVPKLAERGRGQVALVRVAGRFAADRGQREARRMFGANRGAGPETTDPATDAPAVPFAGYDELTARDIIERLPGLSDDELDAVVSYEESHRGRATVIGRVRQLRA